MFVSYVYIKIIKFVINFEKSLSKDFFSICKEGYFQLSSIVLFGVKNKCIDILGFIVIFFFSLCWENFFVFVKNNDILVDFDFKFVCFVDKLLVYQNCFIVFVFFGLIFVVCWFKLI